MSTFLLRVEAIESRYVSHSCPKGTAGRIHSLRLGRRFQSPILRAQTTTSEDSNLFSENEASNLRKGSAAQLKDEALAQFTPIADWTREDSWRSIYGTGSNIDLSVAPNLDLLNASVSQESPQTDDIKRVFWQSLRQDDPHSVLNALNQLVTLNGEEYLSQFLEPLKPNTFTALLRCLDPEHFVGRYSRLIESFNRPNGKSLVLPEFTDKGYQHFCILFLSQIRRIMTARSQSHPFSLADWKYFLKCARATANAPVAKTIWDDLVRRNDVSPDAECFNHYLYCICWAERLNVDQRYWLRVIPLNMTARIFAHKLPHHVGGHTVRGFDGIKAQTTRLFSQMVKLGITGDEETFCHLLTALAREGDTEGMAAILKRVWGIDVEALMTKSEDELPPVKAYMEDSSLYPTDRLLFTLAHTYGINNAIPTALRIIDFTSQHYGIRIPVHVWEELLEWTFVLSRRRSHHHEPQGGLIGQLPPKTVYHLWETMTSEPYNIQPTMSMYDYLIRSLIQRESIGQAMKYMDEAKKLHVSIGKNLTTLIAMHDVNRNIGDRVTEEHRRDLAYAHLRLRRSGMYVRRWVRLWLLYGSRSMRYVEGFSDVVIPDFMTKWTGYLPKSARYRIATGYVRIQHNVEDLDPGAIRMYHLIEKRQKGFQYYVTTMSRWIVGTLPLSGTVGKAIER